MAVPNAFGGLQFDSAGVFSLVHDLKMENVDCDVDLPRLACVGKQSSGKSSVIEALTKLAVPRKEDTCTRGAIEIVTQWSAEVEWLCEISLRLIYDDADNIKRSSPISIPIKTLKDPSELGAALDEAQALILNPRAFLDHKWPGGREQAKAEIAKRPAESYELKFTRNVIQVSLTGKDFHNLIVTDLPGLIQSTETKEDERYIEMIIELCENYCKPKNTVIIACFCCNDDMENQAVHKLARDVDEYGKRTVGVLTKPDLIQEGTEDLWIRVFQNKKYQLSKGYYVVRNRTQAEMDAEADADDIEREFFELHDAGRKFDLFCTERCGMQALRKSLAGLLKGKIEEQLPELHEQLVAKYEENVQALEQMGPALNGELEVRRLLVSCCSSMARKIEDTVLVARNNEHACDVKEDALWNKVEDLFMLTYHKILGTKPLFCNGDETLPGLEEEGAAFDTGREATCGAAGKSPITAGCHVQIEEVRKRIEECRGRNLKVAGSPPAYTVAIEMLKKTCHSWERFALEVLETVLELMTHAVRAHAEEVLREYPGLHQRMVDFLLTLLAEIAVRTHQQVAFFMEMESQNPFTVNAHYLDSQVTKATINLRKKMGKFSVNNLDEYQQRQLSALIAEGGGDMSLMWVADRTGRGENELVTAMAIAQSYFKVAHKRFSDNLLMAVDHMMLRGFATRVEQHLLDSLQVFEAPAESLLSLVREDDVKSRRREVIESSVKRQRDGINRLDKFMMDASLKIKSKRTENRNDTCIGLPDVSGIFSSGRSLSALLVGSRLGEILGTSDQALAASADRRREDKKEKEHKKEAKKKKEEKEKREERKHQEEKEKKEKKERKEQAKREQREREAQEKLLREREAQLKKEQEESKAGKKSESTEKTKAASTVSTHNGGGKKETETTAVKKEPMEEKKEELANGKDVAAEFERLKEKLLEVKAKNKEQEKKAASNMGSPEHESGGQQTAGETPSAGGGGAPPGATPGPRAWIRPQIRPREEEEGTEEEMKARMRRARFGQ